MDAVPREFSDAARVTLTRKLAQGGMSLVHEGILHGYEGFQKRVAVKMLLEQWTEDDRLMRQFIGEAKLVSDLVHENIVQIYQLGRLPTGEYYMLMELVEGVSLREFMNRHARRRRPIPEPLAVHIASRIARGLAYAHAFKDRRGRPLKIVHRDVCPSNILITTEGLAKLIDFGVAKALAQTTLGDNWLTGKVKYMSPEQAARRPVDFRSDLYALGAVLFEMLTDTGIRPVGSDPRTQDFRGIGVPWDRLPARVGREVVEILRRTLAPEPQDRFQDTNELARALEYYIYKDGYGPTIQTVEAYLREHFPELYLRERPPRPVSAPRRTRATRVTRAAAGPDAPTLLMG